MGGSKRKAASKLSPPAPSSKKYRQKSISSLLKKSEQPAADDDDLKDFISKSSTSATATKQKTINVRGINVSFPFEPYAGQLKVMENIVTALNTSQNALLESPTGTGKSLAILCASVAWLQNRKTSQAKSMAALESLCSAPPPTDKVKDAPETLPPVSDDSSDGIKIYIASRTHKQLKQLISELKDNTIYRPKMAILASRDFLCINDSVKNHPNKNDECNERIKNTIKMRSRSNRRNANEAVKTCNYFEKNFSDHKDLRSGAQLEVFDIEDLVTLGKKVCGCPYFTSRSLALNAEIIFSPYSYLFDPAIRKAMNIKPEGNVFILDEAHNIEDAARDASEFSFNEEQLTNAIKNMEIAQNYDKKVADQIKTLLTLLRLMHSWMRDEISKIPFQNDEQKEKVYEGERLLDILKNQGVSKEIFQSILVEALSKIKEYIENTDSEAPIPAISYENDEDDAYSGKIVISTPSVSLLEGLFKVFGNIIMKNHLKDYRALLTETTSRYKNIMGNWETRRNSGLKFICLNPEIAFHELADTARSVILTSGTLSPNFKAGHVIDKSQIWVGTIPCGPKGISFLGQYKVTSQFSYQDDMGCAIVECVKRIPHGVLCFVGSYTLLDKLISRWKDTGLYEQLKEHKHVLCEPRGTDKKEFENILGQFQGHIDQSKKKKTAKGVLLFAVFRGKVSEGLDFKDENARAVLSIGIPYPHWMDTSVQLKRKYNDYYHKSRHLLTGEKWYEAQAFRAINQALGRCIRHRNDWGAIILLEQRFVNDKTSRGLSGWVKENLVVHREFKGAMESLAKFVASNSDKSKIGASGSGIDCGASGSGIESGASGSGVAAEPLSAVKVKEESDMMVTETIKESDVPKTEPMKALNESEMSVTETIKALNESEMLLTETEQKENNNDGLQNMLVSDESPVSPMVKLVTRDESFLVSPTPSVSSSLHNSRLLQMSSSAKVGGGGGGRGSLPTSTIAYSPNLKLSSFAPSSNYLMGSSGTVPIASSTADESERENLLIKTNILCSKCLKLLKSLPLQPSPCAMIPRDHNTVHSHFTFQPVQEECDGVIKAVFKQILNSSQRYSLSLAAAEGLLDKYLDLGRVGAEELQNFTACKSESLFFAGCHELYLDESTGRLYQPLKCKWCVSKGLDVGYSAMCISEDRGGVGYKELAVFPQMVTLRHSLTSKRKW